MNSNRSHVKSENEKLLLDGDLLYINDDRNRRRIDMGNLNNEFVFNLYDEGGNPVIHFDEHGKRYCRPSKTNRQFEKADGHCVIKNTADISALLSYLKLLIIGTIVEL